jgi:hypothetical protein
VNQKRKLTLVDLIQTERMLRALLREKPTKAHEIIEGDEMDVLIRMMSRIDDVLETVGRFILDMIS